VIGMTIGGQTVPARGTFGVVNPATGEVHTEAPDCTSQQLDAAFRAAAGAQRPWSRDEAARRRALQNAGQHVLERSAELAPMLTAEQGKPLNDAVFEIIGAGLWLKHFAEMPMRRQVIRDDAHAHVEVVRRPMGVVAAITPWNYPLVLAAWKIAPALLAGNTMVLKPSPYTPVSTLALGALLQDFLPPGVLNVVSGRDPLGAWMTAHPVPRKISFTGSVPTGKQVMAAASADLKRVTLELGGNDPAIVLDDADIAAIAPRLFDLAFQNCGQTCGGIKRVYVPERLHDDLVEALAARAVAAKVGDGMTSGMQYGPVNNRPQLERVTELVSDAVGRGARAAAGGAPLDTMPGYFYAPTILCGTQEGFRVVDEEQFGPVLPVVKYSTVEDALRQANGTQYGLSGSVWGGDADRATAVAAELECGTAWVNTHCAVDPGQPFGGFKWSGIGVENGTWGLEAFTEVQTLHRARQ
jgi:acyl-CoA reductase-like NAD-dependent aldehyde dehydrogenase